MDETSAQQDGFQRLVAANANAYGMLQRVAGGGGILEQIDRGEWTADLTESQAADLADLLNVMAENVRRTRAIAGLLKDNPPVANNGPMLALAEMVDRSLPLNRKERFYTGTVLPMIIAADGFAHLDRMLALCGLASADLDHSLEGYHPLAFYTEYNFVESRFTASDKARFPDAPTEADTPDVVIAGKDWLLCIEAKVFHNPSTDSLNAQMRRQRVLVDYWTRTLDLDPARVAHVLLLPAGLSRLGLEAPVVTWEAMLDAYRVVGPAYWTAMLGTALGRYTDLVSVLGSGKNAEGRLTGQAIYDLYSSGELPYTHLGRSGGLPGTPLADDITSGKWRNQSYEVSNSPGPANRNWFTIEAFINLI
jgi:hypothetical protein